MNDFDYQVLEHDIKAFRHNIQRSWCCTCTLGSADFWLCARCHERPLFPCESCLLPFFTHLGAPTFRCLYEVTHYHSRHSWINAAMWLIRNGEIPMRAPLSR